jgi:putative lipoprotein
MITAYALSYLLSTQSATRVSGTVSYREKIAIPASAHLHVAVDRFEGLNRTQVSEIKILTRGKQVPLEFALDFFLAKTDEKAKFGVTAKILDGEKLLFQNSEILWLQPGQKNVNILVRRQTSKSVSKFEDIEWLLVEIGSKRPMPSRQRPSIRLNSKDGTTNGHTGVNGFGGTYSLKGDQFAFQPGPMTMMAGTPQQMELERAFLDALIRGNKLKLNGANLQLWDKEQVIATFRAEK